MIFGFVAGFITITACALSFSRYTLPLSQAAHFSHRIARRRRTARCAGYAAARARDERFLCFYRHGIRFHEFHISRVDRADTMPRRHACLPAQLPLGMATRPLAFSRAARCAEARRYIRAASRRRVGHEMISPPWPHCATDEVFRCRGAGWSPGFARFHALASPRTGMPPYSPFSRARELAMIGHRAQQNDVTRAVGSARGCRLLPARRRIARDFDVDE